MIVDILAIGAHPDDVELSCSGTIINAVNDGKSVAIVDLTRGELGTRGTPEIRLQEAAASAKILGVSHRVNLGMADGFFERNEASLRLIIEQIRHFEPEVVLANALSDRHPDHGRAGHLIAEACFLAGLRKIETTLEGVSQQAWRPKAVYHYIQDYFMEPTLVVDISEAWDKKLASIMAFSSQFFDPNNKEPETPISSKGFMDSIKGRAAQMGRLIGAEYGEGFVTKRPPGVDQIFDVY